MARYIDADALIESVCGMCDGICESFDTEKCRNCRRDGRCEWRKSLDEGKTIEARPVVRGEWIEKPHTDGFGGHYFLYHCSRCDTPYAKKRNFCNECGADLRGEA